MDDYTEDAFANRESPLPLIGFSDRSSLDPADDSDNGPPSDRKRGLFKRHASNLKETLKKGHKRSESGRSFNVQDRLLERYASDTLRDEETILTSAGYCNKSSRLRTSLPTERMTPIVPTILQLLPLI